jgi:hypothetical protein
VLFLPLLQQNEGGEGKNIAIAATTARLHALFYFPMLLHTREKGKLLIARYSRAANVLRCNT